MAHDWLPKVCKEIGTIILADIYEICIFNIIVKSMAKYAWQWEEKSFQKSLTVIAVWIISNYFITKRLHFSKIRDNMEVIIVKLLVKCGHF